MLLTGTSPRSSDPDTDSAASQDLDSLAEDMLLEQMLRPNPVNLPEHTEQQNTVRARATALTAVPCQHAMISVSAFYCSRGGLHPVSLRSSCHTGRNPDHDAIAIAAHSYSELGVWLAFTGDKSDTNYARHCGSAA